jgi:hypothetical protein
MSKKIETSTKRKISKKVVIFIVAVLLVVIAVIAFLKIGKKSEGINYINKTTSNFRTILKTNKYCLVVSDVDKETNNKAELILARAGENFVMATDNYRIVIKGEYAYAIYDPDKTMLKSTVNNSNVGYSFSKIIDNNITDKGTKTINDKEYKYEDYGGIKLYLYKNTMEYMEINGSIMKIEKISDEVDESLFNIPTDYKIVKQ